MVTLSIGLHKRPLACRLLNGIGRCLSHASFPLRLVYNPGFEHLMMDIPLQTTAFPGAPAASKEGGGLVERMGQVRGEDRSPCCRSTICPALQTLYAYDPL